MVPCILRSKHLTTSAILWMTMSAELISSVGITEYQIQQGRLSAVLSLSCAVWLCYDHILTLGREVRFIWRHDLSTVTVIFHTVRYAALADAITVASGTIVEAAHSPPAWVTNETLHSASPTPCYTELFLFLFLARYLGYHSLWQ
ncbi:hypothetical protein C8Q79DRAFT_53761 [Trametes meyenii]|nr:hypothetical protein C8Q79DRAFT_53761 [Trametes meyenii]